MNEKSLFTDRRWTDIPKGEVIGHIDITEQEKQEAKKAHEKILKKREEYMKMKRNND